jgi:hypothetical protein
MRYEAHRRLRGWEIPWTAIAFEQMEDFTVDSLFLRVGRIQRVHGLFLSKHFGFNDSAYATAANFC